MLPLVGFLPPTDPRLVGTVEFIQKTLMRDGLVERYRTRTELDGLPPNEG
jgi:GH15 family glucan-1,4-alpha-glucosidase